MGNIIAKLLSAEEPMFSMAIKKLESVSGNPGMDVRLMSEIIQTSQKKLKELGLDAHDTTGEELYYVLLGKIKQHDEHLIKHIGVKPDGGAEEIFDRIKQTVEKSKINRSAWVIKKSAAKRLLQQNPPEKVMKQLGYSSVDSMIKRENVCQILAAMRFVETPAWLKKFNKSYKSINPSDFEDRDIEIVVLDKSRWGNLADGLLAHKRYNLTHLKELGIILLVPPPENLMIEGLAIATLPIVVHYINEIRLYSSFFKLQQVKPDFGKVIAATLNDDEASHAEVAGHNIHWRVIQRHYGRPEHAVHPEIFEPHIQPEDLYWRRAEEQLFLIDPELGFWRNLDYVGILLGDDTPISLNLLDVSMNYYFALGFQDRTVYHMRASLWNEVYMRYIGEKVLEQQILQQLDVGLVNPSKLRL